MRANLLSGLSGETLGYALDMWERGDLRMAALFWQSMALRDDVIASVKAKREKALARRAWQIVTSAPKGMEATAKEQQNKLKEFWSGITAVDAYDRNDRGAFSKLVRQMLTAVSYKYAAHHILWKPQADRVTAEFEFVPPHFFENRTGTLRFCPQGYETTGEQMPADEWMVTCGDGLMVSASIGYLCKRNALTDWLVFSERFGVPGVLGHTKHAAGTAGGNAMADAVESFSNDWNATIYEDLGDGKIELIQAQGGASNLPMPALIERVDRRIAALYRGADLSSISSTSGQGSGASLQGEETDLIEKDDALMVEEKLAEISLQVLRWYYGPDVVPYAHLKISVPTPEDQKMLIDAIKMLVDYGAPISINDCLEKFGFSPPELDAELLKAPLDYKSSYSNAFDSGATDGSGFDLMNERSAVQTNAQRDDDAAFVSQCIQLIAKARVEDQQPIARALKDCLAMPDAALMPALLAFNARLPDYITSDDAQVNAWHSVISSALLRGWTLGGHPANP